MCVCEREKKLLQKCWGKNDLEINEFWSWEIGLCSLHGILASACYFWVNDCLISNSTLHWLLLSKLFDLLCILTTIPIESIININCLQEFLILCRMLQKLFVWLTFIHDWLLNYYYRNCYNIFFTCLFLFLYYFHFYFSIFYEKRREIEWNVVALLSTHTHMFCYIYLSVNNYLIQTLYAKDFDNRIAFETNCLLLLLIYSKYVIVYTYFLSLSLFLCLFHFNSPFFLSLFIHFSSTYRRSYYFTIMFLSFFFMNYRFTFFITIKWK